MNLIQISTKRVIIKCDTTHLCRRKIMSTNMDLVLVQIVTRAYGQRVSHRTLGVYSYKDT